MDRNKTMEVLRGMKFMQRKEETKRRKLFEVDQQKDLRERLRAAASASGDNDASAIHPSSSAPSGPSVATIVYDTGFPHELYSFSRRFFGGKTQPSSPSTTAIHGDNGVDNEDRASTGARNRDTGARGDKYNRDPQDVEGGDEDEDSPTEDPTSVSGTGRFCVNLRAPPLPKKLAKRVAAQKRGRE